MAWQRLAAAAALLLAGCAAPPPPAPDAVALSPEPASGWTAKPGWTARRSMVAAANPLAAQAGAQILRQGGNAIDAAIAVQMVLGLVEPQSSGIGGGALLLYWDGDEIQAWDERETAPSHADPRAFLRADGTPLPHAQAVVGGRAVATPGVVPMLEAAHRAAGRLPWAKLFEPAIRLAEEGFPISPRLHASIAATTALKRDRLARDYFYSADGNPLPAGHRLRNPALAAILRAIAAHGSAAMTRGPIAADLAHRVRADPVPGPITEADLAAYRPARRAALCAVWLERWRVCGFPPPSSGQIALMQILGIVERSPPVALPLVQGVPSADWLHVYAEAARLAFADRAKYVGDPDFVAAPGDNWSTLLADAYLRQRAALIGPRAMKSAPAGDPAPVAPTFAPMAEQPEHGTSHVSIVDAAGHAVAMTTTIESAFGAKLMADGGSGLPGGYLLNNEMTDFSARPADAGGRPVANRIEPGKRPRSTMSPTLVFDRRDGRLGMVLGSPGGPAIVHFVAKTLVGALQWGLDVQRAIDLPNFATFGDALLLETGRFPAATVESLRTRGHRVDEVELTSGLEAIERTPQGWFGGADPRREGIALGD